MLLPLRCPLCGAIGAVPCAACAARLAPAAGGAVPAVLSYDGAGRELLSRLKYRNARSVVWALARAMAVLVDPAALDSVTWAPTTARRRRARGFDQAEVLARAVARELQLPVRATLRRVSAGAQTGRSREARVRSPPQFAPRRPVTGRVLLVDDVVTTGATLAAAAEALRAAGAGEVLAVAAASTPRRR